MTLLAGTGLALVLGLASGSALGSAPSGGMAAGSASAGMNLDEQLQRSYVARLRGGVVAAGCGLRGKGPPVASGVIDLVGLPPGATVAKAILNWSVLESTPPAPTITFHEASSAPASVAGVLLGADESPCWAPSFSSIYAWSADVTAMVAAHGNASYTIALPDSGVIEGAPSAEGAALIVVYCDPAAPFADVVVYEGVQTVNNGSSRQTLDGFVASAFPSLASATFVVADGQGVSNPSWGGRVLVEGSTVIGPPMDGDEGARCGAQRSEFYDVDTVGVLGLVRGGATSLVAVVESYPAPVQGDCLTWSAVAFAVSSQIIGPPPPACPSSCSDVVDAGADVAVCAGASVTLTASVQPSCAPGVAEWRWSSSTTEACPWSASPSCTVTPPVSDVYTVEYRCPGSGCGGSDSVVVTVEPDLVPPDLGNTLRSVRRAGDVAMSWGAVPEARSYTLRRGTAKGQWPPAPLRTGLATPTDVEPDVAPPPALYYYRASGASCSGREGP